MFRHTQLLILTFILLLAAAARLLHIDTQSLWVDEGFTYFTTKQTNLLPILSIDVHPPLYFLLINGWAKLTGTSELALRYLSFLPGMLSVAVVYQIGRELVYQRGANPATSWIPVIAALLLALADIELDLAKEARMYTLHTLFATLSILAYLRWWRYPRASYAVMLAVSSAALVYTNYLGGWTPLLIGLHVLLFLRGRQRITAIGILSAAALLVLPWLLLVGVHQLGNGTGAERADASSLNTLMMYRDNWFGPAWTLTLGLALLGTVTLVYSDRVRVRLRPLGGTILLILWAIVPLAATYIANLWFPVLAAHRISQITPAIVLLIAFGLSNFRQPAFSFLLVVVVTANLTSVDIYRIKGPWREYVNTVAPFVAKDDLVLLEIGGGDYMLEYYFDREIISKAEVRPLKRWREWTPDAYYAGLAPLVEQHSTVWLLQWSSNTDALNLLPQRGFVPTMHRVTDHINSKLEAYRFDQKPTTSIAAFESGMILHAANFDPKPLRLDLLWSAKQPLLIDYTVSAILLNETGTLFAQYDSPPMFNERPTTTWQPDELIYDPHPLRLTSGDPLPAGRYTLGVVVYIWSPEGITRILTHKGEDFAPVGEYNIQQ